MMRYEFPINGKRCFALFVFGTVLPLAVSAGAAEKPKPLTPETPEVKQLVLAKLRELKPEDVEQVKRKIRAIGMAGEDAQKRDKAVKQFLADYVRYGYVLDMTPWKKFDLGREENARIGKLFSSGKLREAAKMFKRAERLVESKCLLDQPGYLIDLLKETKDRDRSAVAERLQKVTRQTFGQDVPAWKKWWSGQKSWGKFDQVAPEVGDLIRFKAVGKALCLDRGHWAEVAKKTDKEQLKRQILAGYDKDSRNKQWALKRARDAVEGPDSRLVFTLLALAAEEGGVGLRSSGETRISFMFGNFGGAFKGVFSRRDETIGIALEERSSPRRRLEVWDSGTGGIRIMLTSLTDGSVLVLHQRPDGKFSVGRADGKGSVFFQEDSFTSFCRKHRKYANERVFSCLKRLGVVLPALPEVPDTAAAQGKAAVPPADSGKADWKTGLLQEIHGDVGRLIGLTVNQKGLCFDRTLWRRVLKGRDLDELRARQEKLGIMKLNDKSLFQSWPEDSVKLAKEGAFAVRLFQQACAQRWGRCGGGWGGGTGKISMNFGTGGKFRAELKIQDDGIEITLVERKYPSRQIEIVDDGRGAMRIRVLGANGEAILLINQAANGRFGVADAMGEQFFVAEEASFKAFSLKYPKYVNERLFGYLRHLGIVTPAEVSR